MAKKKKPKVLARDPVREKILQSERASRRATILTVGGIVVGVFLIAGMYVMGQLGAKHEDEFGASPLHDEQVKVLAIKPAEGEQKRRIVVQVKEQQVETPCETKEQERVQVGDTIRLYYRIGERTKTIRVHSWTTKLKPAKTPSAEPGAPPGP